MKEPRKAKTWKRKIIMTLGALVFFAGGFGASWYFYTKHEHPASLAAIRQNDPSYPFISPLLLAGISNQEANPEYKPLATSINAYIKTAEANGEATDVSVYFRDFNSGRWTGVNENDKYSPASMLKIAVLIAVLQAAASNPSILNQNIYMTPTSVNLDIGQFYAPAVPVVPGNSYSVQQLITEMIVYSDNNAEGLLTDLVGNSAVEKVSSDLQLPTTTSGAIDYMSPKLYSRFYRILYDSTYLSHGTSNAILQLLTQTDFNVGLVAGVPSGTTVAHKFGERTVTDASGTPLYRELHDCGIVYYPNDPYFICVMTKGSDFTKLQPIISDISKIVWNDVASQNQK